MGSLGNFVLARYYARELKLLTDLHSLSQGDLTVQDFYFKLTIIWDELALMEPPKLQNVASYIALRDRRSLTRFLLRLRKEFDSIRSSLLHKSPLPMVEAALNEVLAEAIHIISTSDYLSFSVSSPAVGTVKDGSIPMPNRSTTRVKLMSAVIVSRRVTGRKIFLCGAKEVVEVADVAMGVVPHFSIRI